MSTAMTFEEWWSSDPLASDKPLAVKLLAIAAWRASAFAQRERCLAIIERWAVNDPVLSCIVQDIRDGVIVPKPKAKQEPRKELENGKANSSQH